MVLRLVPLLLIVAGSSALACAAPEPVRLSVSHATFGEIGWHAVDFRCERDRLIVETRAEIAVRILFVEAFQRRVHYVEAWSDDRLLEFVGSTIDNGERKVVRARQEDGRMIIDGQDGETTAPLDVIPSHPWTPLSVERRLLFDVETGALVEVEHRYLGEEYLKIGGEARPARHFATTGGKRRELWYGPDGSWLQWRLERQGTITLTRTDP